MPMTVKVAHVRLCHSRAFYLRAYPRETQEMVFDAHARAFAFFGGTCRRGIYDNMSTAVDAVFLGKDRAFNRRFLQLCSHYLVEPVACTPAAGWEKGQVENQVGFARDNIFKPRLRFQTLEELNGWLEAECRRWIETHRHPELRERTLAEVLEAERPALVPVGEPVRRRPRGRGCRLLDLPRQLRPQPLQRRRGRGTPPGPGPRLRRSDRDPLRRCGGR